MARSSEPASGEPARNGVTGDPPATVAGVVEVREVATPLGPARLHVHEPTGAAAGRPAGTRPAGTRPAGTRPAGTRSAGTRPAGTRPVGTLVLGHGAGGGIGAADLVAVAARLPAIGWRVVLVEQPWRVAGKRVAPAPSRLDVGWRAVMADLSAVPIPGPVVVGGRSAGARVACRTAVETGAHAVVCLSFPLHPPGRPERSRADELAGAGVPVLVVQGERDPFGGPAEVSAEMSSAGVGGIDVVAVPGDHSLAPGAARAAEAVEGWLTSLLRPHGRRAARSRPT